MIFLPFNSIYNFLLLPQIAIQGMKQRSHLWQIPSQPLHRRLQCLTFSAQPHLWNSQKINVRWNQFKTNQSESYPVPATSTHVIVQYVLDSGIAVPDDALKSRYLILEFLNNSILLRNALTKTCDGEIKVGDARADSYGCDLPSDVQLIEWISRDNRQDLIWKVESRGTVTAGGGHRNLPIWKGSWNKKQGRKNIMIFFLILVKKKKYETLKVETES